MKAMRVPVLVVGAVMLATAAGVATQSSRTALEARGRQDAQLSTSTYFAAKELETMLSEARTVALQAAHDSAFVDFYKESGSRSSRIASASPETLKVQAALQYATQLFPKSIGVASFIDATGPENALVANGRIEPFSELEPDESGNPFFTPTFAVATGDVYRSNPYFSADTNEWVIAHATPITYGGKKVALVHFEMTIESLRRSLLDVHDIGDVRVIDAATGSVVLDTTRAQAVSKVVGDQGTPGVTALGNPTDKSLTSLVNASAAGGLTTIDASRVAYRSETLRDSKYGLTAYTWTITSSAPEVAGAFAGTVGALMALLVIGGLALLLFGVILTVRRSRELAAQRVHAAADRDRLNDRLEEMHVALSRAADGDLAVQLPTDGLGDEQMNNLAESFDRTLARLRELVANSQVTGAVLSASATELQALASQQASTSSEQTSAVVETTATIEELAVTATQIAESAMAVARVANETLVMTQNGQEAVRESVDAMGRIAEKVNSISSSTQALADKTDEITQILRFIEDLTEQTNLLSLNAAIEAARAGEHGRGFAVVAAEVRKLAERAQASTSQIHGLIAEVQRHARETAAVTSEGADEVRRGSKLATDVALSLGEIAGQVDRTTQVTHQISLATEQQRSASAQVAEAMTQVSDLARQFSVGSQQSASAAQTLAVMAVQMRANIQTFHVGHEADEPVPTRVVEVVGSRP